MPKIVYLFIAFAFVGDRWGVAGAVIRLVSEALAIYFGAMYEEFRKDFGSRK